MRTIFIPLSKALGLYMAYTGITYTLSMLPVISTLLSPPTNDAQATQAMLPFFGTSIAATLISYFSVILVTVIAAWVLAMKAEWLADKLGISDSDATPHAPVNAILYAGIQLVGLYVIVQGISAFGQALFVSSGLVFWCYSLSSFVWLIPPLLQIGIGLLLVMKTSFIFKILDKNTNHVKP